MERKASQVGLRIWAWEIRRRISLNGARRLPPGGQGAHLWALDFESRAPMRRGEVRSPSPELQAWSFRLHSWSKKVGASTSRLHLQVRARNFVPGGSPRGPQGFALRARSSKLAVQPRRSEFRARNSELFAAISDLSHGNAEPFGAAIRVASDWFQNVCDVAVRTTMDSTVTIWCVRNYITRNLRKVLPESDTHAFNPNAAIEGRRPRDYPSLGQRPRTGSSTEKG